MKIKHQKPFIIDEYVITDKTNIFLFCKHYKP